MQTQPETTDRGAAESTALLETHFGNEQPIVTVPYSSLRCSPLNARTQPLSGIPGLASNILAKGLLQNLVVHEMKGSRGKQRRYGVCAGQRREAALDLLFEQKHIAADYPVPVRIVSEGEALAISLIENSEREGLDPFDVLRSYRMLAEEGRSIDYIAALFSASPLTVRRRMKLASVSPKLLALLREDGITLDQLAALALADDHETQERVWFDAPNDWQRASQYLRQAITRAEIDVSRSRLVRFVGLAAYETAGGFVRRDLFSDTENAGFIADTELLQRLAGEKLETVAGEVRAEGWNWTETRIERDVLELNHYDRLAPIDRAYTEDEQREMDVLTARQDALAKQYDALSEDDENAYEEGERIETELNTVTAAIQALEMRTQAWSTQQMAEAGAFIILDPQGDLVIERGLVRHDSNAARGMGAATTGHAVATLKEANPKSPPVHSAKLCQRLSAHRTAAIHAELIAQPSVALAALLFRLAPVAFPERYSVVSSRECLELNATSNHDALLKAADDLSASTAWGIIGAQRQQWLAALPRNLADLLPWLIEQDAGTTLLDLLAFCTGTLLDGVTGTEGPHALNALSNALQLDMTRYWTATRASYFDHVSKARIVDVAMQAVSPRIALDLSKMKKGDAAAAAELRLAKSAWLPDVLTDREVPPIRALGAMNAPDDEADGDEAENAQVANADEARAPETDAPADTAHEKENHPAWPFPTAASIANAETTQHTA
ncbi:parB-like nuclease domain protein [Paraburkholderia xenovorans LB400]|uniref:Plasmid stabilization protein n=1 Tax=Paraburkholderia xenovorans (strain LB400) TaxID=266265 RepID=Q13XL3_PARXL|nr:ParB/Srx family N-terminal domain-containing protein [Paraburkholderia xenovorans]ABE31176.1 Putative plasmid stabilization protein [Paraburkholderia xenovorans LB400]AIP33394.1 parB-like nuclease domain protein [Paraburkholderia xenovorans LB400]